MRLLTLFTFSFTIIPVLAQSGNFSSICPALDDGKAHEIIPGYSVKYKCNIIGPHNGGTIQAATAIVCAQKCKDTKGCTSSSWISGVNICFLGNGLGSSTQYANAIFMDQAQDPLTECQKQVASQAANLKKQADDQANALRSKNDDLKKRLANGTAPALLPLPITNGTAPALPIPIGSNAFTDRFIFLFLSMGKNATAPNVSSPLIITEGTKKYRVYYQLSSISGNGNDRTLTNIQTSGECLQACNKETTFACTQMVYDGKYKYCYLRKSGENVVLLSTGALAWMATAQLLL
ncbi:hypothetical protein GGI43DRAFT_427084 [Trichoderma evansii]